MTGRHLWMTFGVEVVCMCIGLWAPTQFHIRTALEQVCLFCKP
jgi:hypothetical protein